MSCAGASGEDELTEEADGVRAKELISSVVGLEMLFPRVQSVVAKAVETAES